MKIEQIYTGCLAQGAYYVESNGEVAIIDPLREVHDYINRAERDPTDGGPTKIDGIAFGAMEGPLGPALQEAQRSGRNIHIAGRLELNHWQGRSKVQLRLEDAAWSDGQAS